MKIIDIHTAKEKLPDLIEEALEGAIIIISSGGEPAIYLQPYRRVQKRKPGSWKGKVWISDDFDEIPPGMTRA